MSTSICNACILLLSSFSNAFCDSEKVIRYISTFERYQEPVPMPDRSPSLSPRQHSRSRCNLTRRSQPELDITEFLPEIIQHSDSLLNFAWICDFIDNRVPNNPCFVAASCINCSAKRKKVFRYFITAMVLSWKWSIFTFGSLIFPKRIYSSGYHTGFPCWYVEIIISPLFSDLIGTTR